MIIKAGTKIVIHCSTGYAGEDSIDAFALLNDTSQEVLAAIAFDYAFDYAVAKGESYGRYIGDPQSDETDEDCVNSIEGSWELYDSDLHDDYLLSGNHKEVYFGEI